MNGDRATWDHLPGYSMVADARVPGTFIAATDLRVVSLDLSDPAGRHQLDGGI
jgi:hypothetical protein